MENITEQNNEQNEGMHLTRPSMLSLNETGNWGRFLSILGFCFVGLMLIISLFAGSIFSAMDDQIPFPTIFITVLYVFLAAVYFFPIYYLFKFSTKIKSALINKDSQQLDDAFKNLKSHYKFIGILAAVVLILYALLFIGGLIAGSIF